MVASQAKPSEATLERFPSAAPPQSNAASHSDDDVAKLNEATNLVEEFKSLIKAGEYEQAVLHYSRYRHLPHVEALLRSVLSNDLRSYSVAGQTERFFGLADAWLASYYSDADILLIVAKQHRAMDYVQEALNVLQLAMTYSQGSEKNTAYKALQEFIQDTDSQLSRDLAWSRLQAFYETLSSMGLDSTEDRIRLAEIYLFNGKENAGRELLLQASNDSQFRSRAEGILQRYDAEGTQFNPQENRKDQFVSRIAMKRMGKHYLLPLLSTRGSQVNLLLDTGASTTLLSSDAFNRFTRGAYARYLGPRIFNTANGLSRGHAYSIPQLTFGPFTLENLEVSVSDADFGGEFDGLLGMNILQQFTFQIDQQNSELLLNRR